MLVMFYHLGYSSQYDLQALCFYIFRSIDVPVYIPLKRDYSCLSNLHISIIMPRTAVVYYIWVLRQHHAEHW